MTISGATIANNSAGCAAPSTCRHPTRVALRGSDTSVASVRGSTAPACTIVGLAIRTISGATIANNSAACCPPSTRRPTRSRCAGPTRASRACAAVRRRRGQSWHHDQRRHHRQQLGGWPVCRASTRRHPTRGRVAGLTRASRACAAERRRRRVQSCNGTISGATIANNSVGDAISVRRAVDLPPPHARSRCAGLTRASRACAADRRRRGTLAR